MSIGTAEITIFCARGIKRTPLGTKHSFFSKKENLLNAYVAVDVDGIYMFKTNSYPKSNTPYWNQSTKFPAQKSKSMRFIVFDKGANDSYVADVKIPVNSSINRKWVELNPTGSLYISLKFRDNKEIADAEINSPRIFVVNYHRFMITYFRQPTLCSCCDNFICRFAKMHGYQCQLCAVVAHEECFQDIVGLCTQSNVIFHANENKYRDLLKDHLFLPCKYIIPNMCRHCGTRIGVFTQGFRCSGCSMDIHKRCLLNVPSNCGVDFRAVAIEQDGSLEISDSSQSSISTISPIVFTKVSNKDPTAEAIAQLRSKISHTDETLKLDHFKLIKVIGRGCYGKVMLAEKVSDGRAVAIKALRKHDVIRDNELDFVMAERDCLSVGNKHNFLGKLLASFQNQGYLFLVTELYLGGEMFFRISERDDCFNEFESVFYSGEVAIALNYLHELQIIHRDIKMDNIMLDREGHVRLIDFGFCKTNIDVKLATTMCGNPPCISPEILNGVPYGKSTDWWSFGILLYCFLAGDYPFDADSEDELYPKILSADIYIPSRLSNNSKQILMDILRRNPKNRLGCRDSGESEIFQHPFYTSTISFSDLRLRKIKPPWIPQLDDKFDDKYFDEQPKREFLPKIDNKILNKIDQTLFIDFDLTVD